MPSERERSFNCREGDWIKPARTEIEEFEPKV